MAVKFVYSDTEVAEITQKYQAGVSLDELATAYNKSVASVRMKLVKLGIYQKAAPTSTPRKPKLEDAASFVVPTVDDKFPTTKSGILARFRSAMDFAGPAPF